MNFEKKLEDKYGEWIDDVFYKKQKLSSAREG